MEASIIAATAGERQSPIRFGEWEPKETGQVATKVPTLGRTIRQPPCVIGDAHHQSQRLIDRFIAREHGRNVRRQTNEIRTGGIPVGVLSTDTVFQNGLVVFGSHFIIK